MKSVLRIVLKYIAKAIIRKYHPDVVGITGSVGKTTTKNMIVCVLSERFRVRGNEGSFNNELGLPLTIIGGDDPHGSAIGWLRVVFKGIGLVLKRDRHYPELLVLEMGADRPGDIRYLTDMVPCSVGVVTAVAPTHLEFFKTVKKVAQEKRIIVSHLKKDGFAILNHDDAEVLAMQKKTDADVITYGFHPQATIRGAEVQGRIDETTGWPDGVLCKVDVEGSVVPIFIPHVLGEQVIYSALAAIAVGMALGVNPVEASDALRSVVGSPGRVRLLPGIKKTLLIDDTYNASPASVRAGLATLSHVDVKGRGERYAVLGDMLELGKHTSSAHREVGLRVAELGIDFFITVGEAMKEAADAAREAGMSDNAVVSFATSEEAGRFVQEKMEQGDVIYIKGSRGVKMEKITKEIMAQPLRAKELLVH